MSTPKAVLDRIAAMPTRLGRARGARGYEAGQIDTDSDPDREGYDATNTHFPVEFVNQERWATFVREYWKLVA